MEKERLVSKKSGEIAEVVKVENGVYTLIVAGKEIKVKEGTVRRWWKKEEIKSIPKVKEKNIKKQPDCVEQKKDKKSVEKKIEDKNKQKKTNNTSIKKFIKIKTTFPLRSYWNFAFYGRHSDLRKGIKTLNKEQKQEMIKYFLENDKDGKHSKFLKKEGLIK